MKKPPKFALVFLRLIAGKQLMEEIEGDLYEDFLDNLETKGLQKARMIYLWTALFSLRPYILRHNQENRKPKHIDMIAYNLKMAFRHLSNNKAFSTINIFGLTVGLTASMAIILFVIDLSIMDSAQTQKDHIYRLESTFERGGETIRQVSVHSNTMPSIGNDIPGIEAYARVIKTDRTLIQELDGGQNFLEEEIIFADADFFKIFDLEVLQGDKNSFLQGPNDIVLTASAATRYFGDENPIGKSLAYINENVPQKIVVGVVADPTSNSSLQYDFIGSNAEFFPPEGKFSFESQYYSSFPVYMLLSPGTSPESVASKFVPELKKHTDREATINRTYRLSAFADLKHDMEVSDGIISPTDSRVVTLFVIIAVFIIALAVVNYVNLTSAKAIQRSREVGIRKVNGAGGNALIGQFLTESLLTFLLSVPLAFLLLDLMIPYLEHILERKLFFDYDTDATFLLVFSGAILLLAFIAGLYPSLLLSKVKLDQLNQGPDPKTKGALLRKVLVVFQFSFSVALVITMILLQNQMKFTRQQTLGYSAEQIIVLKGTFAFMKDNYKTVKNSITQIPGVSQVAVANGSPGDTRFMSRTRKDLSAPIAMYFVDEDYLDLLGINIISGSNFDMEADSLNSTVLVNQSLVNMLEIEEPLYSKAHHFQGAGNSKIIGIVEDFHFESLHQKVRPVVICPAPMIPQTLKQYLVKVETENFEEIIDQLQAIWQEFYPRSVFNYEFMDDKLGRFYKEEKQLSEVMLVFTVLAIIISCLGLFGLSMHMAQVKMKETSIRKVLGASVSQVALSMAKKIYGLIGVAAVIAVPIAYYFIDQWLLGFAYRMDISITPFVLSLAGCLVIVTVTIGWHTIKTAVTNPVDALRTD